jgi:MFS family permease
MNLHPLLRSLAHRNYRLYFAGQGISLIGTWMQQVAMSWLVYQMTQSSFQLSLVLFAGQIPALFLAPVAGVLVDRWERHRVLLLTQSLAMGQAFLLALLTWTGRIEVWQLIGLNLFLGIVNTIDMTTRQAFLSEMVTNREDLGNGWCPIFVEQLGSSAIRRWTIRDPSGRRPSPVFAAASALPRHARVAFAPDNRSWLDKD